MTLGVFPGTFNPIHLGHLILAETARVQCHLERIVFVPAALPPHRQADPELIDFEHRLAMVARACRSFPFFTVSALEAHLPMPSYTIQTLEAMVGPLGEADPTRDRIAMIIGRDALAGLATWHRPRDLAMSVRFLQARREGQAPVTTVTLDGETVSLVTECVEMPMIAIAATHLRASVRAGRSIRGQVPDSVADYIAWNGLYR